MSIPRSASWMALLLAGAACLCLALAAAAAAGDPAQNLRARGQKHLDRQQYRLALDLFRQAIQQQEREQRPVAAGLLREAGVAALYLSDFSTSLGFLLSGLAAADAQGQPAVAVECAYRVGYIHRDRNNFPDSRRYFAEALRRAEAAGDERYAILSLNELGNIDILETRYAEALAQKEKALARARAYGDFYVLSACLHDIGVYHTYRGDHARALPFYEEALAIDSLEGGKRNLIVSLTNRATCLAELGRFREALADIDRALRTAGENELPKDIMMVHDHAAGIYEKMGDYRRAMASLKKSEAMSQGIFTAEQTRQIAEMQERFESVKREKENELLRRDNEIQVLALEKQVNLRNSIVVLSLLVLLSAGLVYWRYREKARANARLEAANLEIHAQKKKLEDAYGKMEALAREDALTGLPNRRVALEALERESQRSQRSGRPLAILMGDLDGFKAINDGFGHDAGDSVLKAVSALLRASLRSQDTLARWGGDEFIILLPETDRRGAETICAALKDKVQGHAFEFQGRPAAVALSLGLALFERGKSGGDCLREADRDMYRQKKSRP